MINLPRRPWRLLFCLVVSSVFAIAWVIAWHVTRFPEPLLDTLYQTTGNGPIYVLFVSFAGACSPVLTPRFAPALWRHRQLWVTSAFVLWAVFVLLILLFLSVLSEVDIREQMTYSPHWLPESPELWRYRLNCYVFVGVCSVLLLMPAVYQFFFPLTSKGES